MDGHKNLAVSAVATAPSPATTGTSLVVTAGHGTRFPTPPFNATVWPTAAQPTPANAEIIRVNAIATDTFTIEREAEVGGLAARSIVVGDQIAATITSGLLDQMGLASQSLSYEQTQTAHGLAAADVIRINGSGDYVKAQANSAANAEVVGVVTEVADADNFRFVAGGRVENLAGLTDGTVYFLSPTTAGLLTATEPTTAGQISKPLLVAINDDVGLFFNMRGLVVGAAGEPLGVGEELYLSTVSI